MKGTVLFACSKKDNRFFSQRVVKENGKLKLGDWELDNAKWNSDYENLLLFQFRNRNYICAQAKNNNRIFIQEINKDGTLAMSESDSATWNNYYPNLFSYSMNGRVYLVGQHSGRYFFIQEINSNGTFGRVTYSLNGDSRWKGFYPTMGCIEVGGRMFMYAQKNEYHTFKKNDYRFFIQELTADGRLSDNGETNSDNWSRYYKTMGSVKVGGRAYIYGQSDDDNKFFIQEINSNGQITGGETYSKKLGHFYDDIASLYIEGRSYVYGLSEGEKRFFIQEVLPGGKLAADSDCSYPNWGNSYSSMAVLTHNDFVFGDNWMDEVYQEMSPQKQEKVTLKDYCMPASHDSGMYELPKDVSVNDYIPSEFTAYTKFIPSGLLKQKIEQLALTQNRDILGQLRKGVRYLDFRPGKSSKLGNTIYLMHDFVPGAKLSDALSQIRTFMAQSQETVILMFSHIDIGKSSSGEFISMVQNKLGDKLLKENDIDDYFNNRQVKKSINNLPMHLLRGKVVVLISNKKEEFDFSKIANRGIYEGYYFGMKEKPEAESRKTHDKKGEVLFTVFDDYANAQKLEDMKNDQDSKFEAFGLVDGRTGNRDSLCAVDWTLTAPEPKEYTKDAIQELLKWSIEARAYYVNKELFNNPPRFLLGPNRNKRIANFISLDFVPNGIIDSCIEIMKSKSK